MCHDWLDDSGHSLLSLSPSLSIICRRRPLIDSIISFIVPTGTASIVCCTRLQNCSYDSCVMALCNASFLNLLAAMLNTFLKPFHSGDLAGILNSSHPTLLMAPLACALFWDGSPSIKNVLFSPFSAAWNMDSKFSSMKVSKKAPHILSYFWHMITPLL